MNVSGWAGEVLRRRCSTRPTVVIGRCFDVRCIIARRNDYSGSEGVRDDDRNAVPILRPAKFTSSEDNQD